MGVGYITGCDLDYAASRGGAGREVEKEGRVDAAERKRIKDNEIADRIEDLRAYLKTPTATCPWEDIPWLLDQLTEAQGRIAELEGLHIAIRNALFYLEQPEPELRKVSKFLRDALGWEQQPTTLTKEGGGGE